MALSDRAGVLPHMPVRRVEATIQALEYEMKPGGRFLILIAAAYSVWSHALIADGADPDFRFDVRPILSRNCFACHGPDEDHREAELRLDDRDAAIEAGAIVPGDPEGSEVFRRITSDDHEERMPPSDSDRRLSAADIETLRAWIAAGAPYARHWAYEPPQRPTLPTVRDRSWPKNPIDDFILAKLDAVGLNPEPEADRARLIRRVSLDLIGLPPTIEEVDAFVADGRDDAYERVVDRLLESPAFGEHWASKWLDLARYADTCGYEKDSPRTIWPFRDWVIKALNDDMPFDQFTVEQIAGDLLPNPTHDQIVATAFHRNTMQNDEGGADDEEYRVAAVVDRVNTTMQVWMGTTMGCARCHSHKYDPFTQREYYELFAFFNQTADADRYDQEPLLLTPSPEDEELRTELNALLAANEAEQERQAAALTDDQLEWEAAVRGDFVWRPMAPTSAMSHDGQSCNIQRDHSVQVSGEKTSIERYEVQGASDLNEITALRLEVLPDLAGAPPPGSDEFVLSRIRVLPGDASVPQDARFVRIDVPHRHQYLKMAEVQVYRGDENVAPAGVALQSSTAYEGNAQLAIDGRTDPDFAGGRSTSHTAFDFAPWWEVDLGKATAVDRIALWASAENQHRLVGARVTLLDASRNPLWGERVRIAPDMAATFYPSSTSYPQLALAGSNSQRADNPAMHAIENRDAARHGWSPDLQQTASPSLFVSFDSPWRGEAPIRWRVMLEQHDAQETQRRLRKFRISATDDPRAAQAAAVPPEICDVAQIPSDRRTPEQATTIREYYQSINPALQALKAEREDIELRMTDQLRLDKTPIMRELPSDKQRKTHIHIRGSFLDLGEAVEPGMPEVFHQFPAESPRNRLGFAQWLVDRQNPLTARVAANRVWEQLFGIGIVRTSEDFGSQGTLPAYPPLLDWLATELMDRGWSLKHLTKTIVMSAAYRQSARTLPGKLAADPENLLISRGPKTRLTAEQIRDQALFSSGLLSRKMYGPSVMPYQPEGVWQVVYSDDRWKLSSGEDRFRRGLYTYWRRTSPYPSAMSLDATSRETCAIRRITTNTPVAALALLNDPAAVEAARALARKVVTHEPSDTASKAYFAFRRVLLRPPTDSERQRIERLFTDQRERYEHDLKAAAALAVGDDNESASRRDLPALAAWTVVGNVLLNLDETVTK